MVYGIINIFLKYLVEDLPLLITSFICMFIVLQIYLPKTTQKRKLLSLFIIEGFEHLALPVILILTLIFTDSWLSAFFFHAALLSFLFLFLGVYILKARTKEEWFRISAVAAYTYLFVFTYPFIIIYLQLHSPLNGWIIMGTTIFLFWLFYRFRIKNRGYS